MSEPSKCFTIGAPPDTRPGEGASRAEAGHPAAGRRFSDAAVRLIENWIVGVVTALSAGVIVVTLLAHHDVSEPLDRAGQAAIDAAPTRH